MFETWSSRAWQPRHIDGPTFQLRPPSWSKRHKIRENFSSNIECFAAQKSVFSRSVFFRCSHWNTCSSWCKQLGSTSPTTSRLPSTPKSDWRWYRFRPFSDSFLSAFSDCFSNYFFRFPNKLWKQKCLLNRRTQKKSFVRFRNFFGRFGCRTFSVENWLVPPSSGRTIGDTQTVKSVRKSRAGSGPKFEQRLRRFEPFSISFRRNLPGWICAQKTFGLRPESRDRAADRTRQCVRKESENRISCLSCPHLVNRTIRRSDKLVKLRNFFLSDRTRWKRLDRRMADGTWLSKCPKNCPTCFSKYPTFCFSKCLKTTLTLERSSTWRCATVRNRHPLWWRRKGFHLFRRKNRQSTTLCKKRLQHFTEGYKFV